MKLTNSATFCEICFVLVMGPRKPLDEMLARRGPPKECSMNLWVKKSKFLIIGGVLLTLVFGGVALERYGYLGKLLSASEESKPAAAPAATAVAPADDPMKWPLVRSSVPTKRKLREWMTFTGTTRADVRVEIRSRVRGYLKECNVKDGAIVVEGQPLFVIDQEPFLYERDAAKANLDRAMAVRDRFKSNYDRTQTLLDGRATSAQQLETDRAEFFTAEANVASAKAAYETANLNLTYTVITAPISGRMGMQLIDEGNLVQADQTLLAVIESIEPIHAYFTVSERDLLKAPVLRPHMPMMEQRVAEGLMTTTMSPVPKADEIQVALGDSKEYAFSGEMDYTEYGIDASTGTTMRRVKVADPEGQLVPGMFVRVRVSVSPEQDRLLVKQQAVGSDQVGDFLLIIGADNVVEKRSVTLGPTEGDYRVIRTGLSEGENVVISGLQRARPGSKVRFDLVDESPATPASPTAGAAEPATTKPVATKPAAAAAQPIQSTPAVLPAPKSPADHSQE